MTAYRGEKVAVFGLGRSGLAAVEALTAGGAEVLADDDCDARRAAAARCGARPARLGEAEIAAARALVLSPGVPRGHRVPALADRAGTEVVGETELFARALRPRRADGPRLVGVTGTNGKSTATALVGHLLGCAGVPVQLGSNFGVAALALDPMDAGGVYALEMSSFQLELTSSLVFDVAALLNIGADHLDRHGGMAGYIAAKKRIFRHRTAAGTAIVARDDPIAASVFDELAGGPGRLVAVSGLAPVQGGVGADGGRLMDGLDGPPRAVADLDANPALIGVHNRQNAALAWAVCRALGFKAEALADGVAGFPGLRHRLEPVTTIAGVRFVNDSKATNAAAAARALACYRRIYWIAGGRAKDADLEPVAPLLNRVRRAYLIGEAAESFAEALAGRAPVALCGALDRAVARAAEDAAGDDGAVVLLSPACASFDQFADFEARGAHFRALVEGLASARPEAAR